MAIVLMNTITTKVTRLMGHVFNTQIITHEMKSISRKITSKDAKIISFVDYINLFRNISFNTLDT